MVVDAALQEDVDVVSVSILSGAHMTLVPRVRELMNTRGLSDVQLIAGGIIPDADADALKKLPGIAGIFGPGTSTKDVVAFIQALFTNRK
jgi:methylmalonyl-CoA mutase C-terminal domain/subunit